MADRLGVDEALRDLLRSLPQVAAGLKQPGVPPALQVLLATLGPRHIPLLSHLLLDGPMGVGQLAERLGLAMPTTSLLVRDLEEAGLVDRSEDPADRRRRQVRIRAERRNTVQDWLARRAEPITATLHQLSPEQRWTLAHSLRLLAGEFCRHRDGG